MKSTVKNYLSLTKKEWNGLVILVVLIMLVSVTPYLYQLLHKDKVINFNGFYADAARLSAAGKNYEGDNGTQGGSQLLLFAFNPNHLHAEKWKQLGLSDHQISVLRHYENKGGRFNTKADVQKIYSITPEDYKRLEPYIQLPDGAKAGAALPIIDINRADSATITTLKGIGPAYAMRIIRYRDKLGGFHSKMQLKEVFGIDEEHFLLIEKQLKVSPSAIKKLNINKATFDDLRRFPYLSYKQVNAIIQYRAEHGDYDNIDDMKDVAILDEVALMKIKPYLVFK